MAGERRLLVAITGASGATYGVRMLEVLADRGPVGLVVSAGARKVLEAEGTFGTSLERVLETHAARIEVFDERDVAAGPSSGSYPMEGMAIIPCSMNTLAALAAGSSGNLIHRAAHVTLKEGRRLVIVPRETPLNILFLENLLKVARAGATVLPAMPGFYHRPESLRDQVDFVVGKTLDQFGMDHDLFRRWGG